MTDNESLDFLSLLAESSLGSQGAQELISRTEPAVVSRVLETAQRIESLKSTRDACRFDRPDFEIKIEAIGEGAWLLVCVNPPRGDFAFQDNERLDIPAVHDITPGKRPTRMSDAEADALRARLGRGGASSGLTRAGFTSMTACDAVGISRRQLDYWARTGLVEPSLRDPNGSDRWQWYSFRDVLTLKVVKSLLDAGITLQQIRTAIQHLQERRIDDLTHVTLMSDGASIYECTNNDEVIDLLQGGQGVFGIALGGVWRDVEAKLSELTGDTSQPAAELTEDLSDESRREDMSVSCWSRDGS